MATTAADILIETLIDWGVEVIFGLPGDGINGIMESLRQEKDKIRFIQVRHEEAAAFMACGYAKYTGKLGVSLATSGPGGIHLLNGLYDAKMDGAPVLAITGHHFHGKAADILNSGERVAILAGRGALTATDELIAAADRLGAPIIKALLGKACVPDDSPFTTGGIGLLGTRPSQEAMENCDTLFIVGSSFPYIEFLPKPDQARGVQIDLDPTRIGLRFPVNVGLAGDCKRTLELLLPFLKPKKDRSFLETARKGMKHWWELMKPWRCPPWSHYGWRSERPRDAAVRGRKRATAEVARQLLTNNGALRRGRELSPAQLARQLNSISSQFCEKTIRATKVSVKRPTNRRCQSPPMSRCHSRRRSLSLEGSDRPKRFD
jgi:thiamine pyrophosphate-dependent acetolactate synthase large subunit-like protein